MAEQILLWFLVLLTENVYAGLSTNPIQVGDIVVHGGTGGTGGQGSAGKGVRRETGMMDSGITTHTGGQRSGGMVFPDRATSARDSRFGMVSGGQRPRVGDLSMQGVGMKDANVMDLGMQGTGEIDLGMAGTGTIDSAFDMAGGDQAGGTLDFGVAGAGRRDARVVSGSGTQGTGTGDFGMTGTGTMDSGFGIVGGDQSGGTLDFGVAGAGRRDARVVSGSGTQGTGTGDFGMTGTGTMDSGFGIVGGGQAEGTADFGVAGAGRRDARVVSGSGTLGTGTGDIGMAGTGTLDSGFGLVGGGQAEGTVDFGVAGAGRGDARVVSGSGTQEMGTGDFGMGTMDSGFGIAGGDQSGGTLDFGVAGVGRRDARVVSGSDTQGTGTGDFGMTGTGKMDSGFGMAGGDQAGGTLDFGVAGAGRRDARVVSGSGTQGTGTRDFGMTGTGAMDSGFGIVGGDQSGGTLDFGVAGAGRRDARVVFGSGTQGTGTRDFIMAGSGTMDSGFGMAGDDKAGGSLDFGVVGAGRRDARVVSGSGTQGTGTRDFGMTGTGTIDSGFGMAGGDQAGGSLDFGVAGAGRRDVSMVSDSGIQGAGRMDLGMTGGGVVDSGMPMDSSFGMDAGTGVDTGGQGGVFPADTSGGQDSMSQKPGMREASAAANLLKGLTDATQSSNLVDLNPVASDVGANVVDKPRRDFPSGAAATAVDTSITDTDAAGADRSATGAVDLGATKDTSATGAEDSGTQGSDTSVGMDSRFVGDRTRAGTVDLSLTGGQGAGIDLNAQGALDASMGVDGSSGTGTGFGNMRGSSTAGADRTAAGSLDLRMKGPEGAGIDLTATGTVDASMGGAGMGMDTAAGADGGFIDGTGAAIAGAERSAAGTIDLSMTGKEGGSIDLSASGTRDARVGGVVGAPSDLGFVGDGGSAAATTGDISLADKGVAGADRSIAGAVDLSMTGQGGASADMRAAGALDTSITTDVGGGMGVDSTGALDTGLIGDSGIADGGLDGGIAGDMTGGVVRRIGSAGVDSSLTGDGSAGFNVVGGRRLDRPITGDGRTDVDVSRSGVGGAGSVRVDAGLTGDGSAGFNVEGGRRLDSPIIGDGRTGIDASRITGSRRSVIRRPDDRMVSTDIASSSAVDMGMSGRGEMGTETNVVVDRRVADALAAITGQMTGTGPETGTGDKPGSLSVDGTRTTSFTGQKGDGSFSIDGSRSFTGTGERHGGSSGLSANVLDGRSGVRDFPTAPVRDTSGTDSGTSTGIFAWTGRTGGTGASRDGALPLDRSGDMSIRRDTGATRGTGDTSLAFVREGAVSVDRSGEMGMAGTGDASMTFDRTRTSSGTGTRGDATMTLDGTGRTSIAGERRDGTMSIDGSRGRTGAVSFDTSGDMGMTGTGDGSVIFDTTGTLSGSGTRGGATMTLDGTGRTSIAGERRDGKMSIDGSRGRTGAVSFDTSGDMGMTGTGDASVTFDSTGSLSGSGVRGDGSMAFDRTGSMTGAGARVDGSVAFERAGTLSGTGAQGEGSMIFDRTGSVRGTGTGAGGRFVDGSRPGDRRAASQRLSLEERTVRQGEWSATWNYEGAVPEWFRHRVDPAPCMSYGCNLASCYVPNPHDCKSYIVCQRTAMGTYVATRMRCAFGSFWTASNIWTCERLDDVKIEAFNCPNDPCRDPKLSRYPDEDFNNCRSFWQCVNGRSRPRCCPPGQRFDRKKLSCVNDYHEVCREPCPLKQEGCLTVAGANKQPFYDGNCRTYWDCGEHGAPHPVCCPRGQSFEPGTEKCIESGCNDKCPREYKTDICAKIPANGQKRVEAYDLKDGNCRTFMKCSKEGESIAYCCRAEHFFNKATAKCEKLYDLYDPCMADICPDGYKEECRFEPVANPRQMYSIDAGLVIDCGPGTEFNLEKCTCDFAKEPFKNICKKEVDIKFDHPERRYDVKNYGDGWISVFGEMTKNASSNGKHYGRFNGHSGMEVWRYDHNVFPEIDLKITFQPDPREISRQILVSNCETTTNTGEPSLEVALNPDTSMITFTGRSANDTSVAELQYNKNDWNTYTLYFDGHDVLAMIENPNARGKRDSTSVRLKGELLRGMGPLIFGPCRYNGGKKTNGFYGRMSEVILSKCLDEASRMFMRQTLAQSMEGPI